MLKVERESSSESEDEVGEEGGTLFVKNLNFNTTEEALKKVDLVELILILYRYI